MNLKGATRVTRSPFDFFVKKHEGRWYTLGKRGNVIAHYPSEFLAREHAITEASKYFSWPRDHLQKYRERSMQYEKIGREVLGLQSSVVAR